MSKPKPYDHAGRNSRQAAKREAQEMADDLRRRCYVIREKGRGWVARSYTPGNGVVSFPVYPSAYLYDSEIPERNAACGGHFFDKATMRSFASRLLSGFIGLPDGSAVFVTSEQFRWRETHAARRYTVRVIRPSGEIASFHPDPPGLAFQEHSTAKQARAAAKRYAETQGAKL